MLEFFFEPRRRRCNTSQFSYSFRVYDQKNDAVVLEWNSEHITKINQRIDKNKELDENDRVLYERLTGQKHKEYPSLCRTNKIRWTKSAQNLCTLLIWENNLMAMQNKDNPMAYLLEGRKLPWFTFIEAFHKISQKIMQMIRVPDIYTQFTLNLEKKQPLTEKAW